ncbi:Crp/Fnr family transcriptional regulator [Crocinitomix catalasitica]|uniref:Crp/Fnr family transcriptional regulator n=1 Tax=Crocinitomix catalasitica TaxID=184607 RepID=UPI00056283B1|nr:Crp/Fnr family transcriptional regulator [Crocinitomix catalasitica]
MKHHIQPLLEERYGFLFEAALIEEIAEVSTLMEVKAGETIMDYGQNIKGMPLMLSGAMKVLRQDKEGDELVIYYLESGDVCTMTLTCCLGQKQSEIKAVAERDSTYLFVPIIKMKEWIKKYDSWMAFVFESYDSRFNELLEAIDNLAFNDLNKRLHKYLKDKVLITKSTLLELSHQEIAYDMHTSRVVVSRLLKSLEKEDVVKLGRNKIEVLQF